MRRSHSSSVEYGISCVFCFFAALIFALVYMGTPANENKEISMMPATTTAISFLCGASTSMFCGFVGMKIATFSNARTTKAASALGSEGYREGFNTAFRGGGVMGYALCSIGVLMLWLLLSFFKAFHAFEDQKTGPI